MACNFKMVIKGKNMNVGKKIRLMRERKGWSQKTLGENCNPPIAEPTIRRYELGKLNPKIETCRKIAKALGVPVNVLIGEEDVLKEILDRIDSEVLDTLSDGVVDWFTAQKIDDVKNIILEYVSDENDNVP